MLRRGQQRKVARLVTRPGLAAAASLRGGSARGARTLARALEAAAAAISRYGGAGEGDRTMLDALAPAARALQEGEAAGARPKPLCMGRSPAGGCAARRAPLTSRLAAPAAVRARLRGRTRAAVQRCPGRFADERTRAAACRQPCSRKAHGGACTLRVRNWCRACPGCGVPEALRRAAEAAAAGAQRTAALAAGAGRASYVPGAQYQGHPDPGALGVAVWLQAAADAVAHAPGEGRLQDQGHAS